MSEEDKPKVVLISGDDHAMKVSLQLMRNSQVGAHSIPLHNINRQYGSMYSGTPIGTILHEPLLKSRLLGLSPKYMHPKETAHIMEQVLRKRQMLKYLETNFENFWNEIFDVDYKTADGEGLITAHHDKIHQYRETWEEAGLDFNICAMIYLLTFTSEMDRPKPESEQWVIDNYNKYLLLTPETALTRSIKRARSWGEDYLDGSYTVFETVEFVAQKENNDTVEDNPVLHNIGLIAETAGSLVIDEIQHINEKYQTDVAPMYRECGDEPIPEDHFIKGFMELKRLVMETELTLNAKGINTNLIDHDKLLQADSVHFPQDFKDKLSQVLSPDTPTNYDGLKPVYKDGEVIHDVKFFTVDEMITDLIATVSREDKMLIAEMKEDDLIQLHHTLGQHIRNTYNLWHDQCPLTNPEHHAESGVPESESMHPDDVSFRVIVQFWTKLNEGEM